MSVKNEFLLNEFLLYLEINFKDLDLHMYTSDIWSFLDYKIRKKFHIKMEKKIPIWDFDIGWSDTEGSHVINWKWVVFKSNFSDFISI